MPLSLPKEDVRHFFRFFATSCIGLGADYGCTAAGVYMGISPYTALVLGMLVGAVVGFLLLTYWVFPTQEGSFSLRRIGGFILGMGLLYVVRALCVWLWQGLGLSEAYIYFGLLVAYGVSFVTNFCFQKFLVFIPKKEK